MLKIELQYITATRKYIPNKNLFKNLHKNLHTKIHSRFINNNLKVETTQMPTKINVM